MAKILWPSWRSQRWRRWRTNRGTAGIRQAWGSTGALESWGTHRRSSSHSWRYRSRYGGGGNDRIHRYSRPWTPSCDRWSQASHRCAICTSLGTAGSHQKGQLGLCEHQNDSSHFKFFLLMKGRIVDMEKMETIWRTRHQKCNHRYCHHKPEAESQTSKQIAYRQVWEPNRETQILKWSV